MATVIIKVFDSSTQSPISGAAVFANGVRVQPLVVTDSSGSASITLPSSGSNLIQITAGNYNGGQAGADTSTLSTQTVSIPLDPASHQSSVVNIQFIPTVPGILWQIKSGIFVIDNGVSITDGSSISSNPITFGSYTIEADYPGYAHASVPFTVNGQTDPYTITLVADPNSDSIQKGNNTGDSLASTTSGAPVSSAITEPPAVSEYIYPNTDYDKYFTITGARIYVGNLFIDEVSSIQYGLQDNAVPVFGYASRFYDALGQGRSMVQGQISLNFVSEGYLFTVLQEYKRFLSSTQGKGFPITSLKVDTVAQVLSLMATRDNLLQQARNNPNTNSTPGVTDPEIRAGKLQAQIAGLMNGMTPDQIDSLSNQKTRQLKGFSDVVAFDNAVYQDVLFDIRIEFGNEITGVKRVRYLEKCKLISNEQVIAPDGQTILDSYGFIARRLR